MAQVADPEEVAKAQAASQKKIEVKRASQKKQGKKFVVDPDGHGPGVIPEKDWRAMK